MADHGHDDEYNAHAHISTIKTNIAVLGVLLFLTFLTVLAYNVRLGDLNLFVAVAIAMVKATVVGAWFMHLKYEKKFNILFFAGSLIFVAIFIGYTMNDTAHRGRQGSITGLRVDPGTGSRAYGTDPLLRENGEFLQIVHEEHEGEHEHDEGEHADGDAEEHTDEHGAEGTEEPTEVEEVIEDVEEAVEEAADEAAELIPTMDPAPAAMAPAAPAAMAPPPMATMEGE